MVVFRFPLGGWAPALAVVAAHGLTDVESTTWLPNYLLWTVFPLPSFMITGAFCVSSITHFIRDGEAASIGIHLASLLAGYIRGKNAAMKVMISYLVAYHVPLHYARHYKRKNHRGLALCGIATSLGLLYANKFPATFVLTDFMQRLVIAHIATELSADANETGAGGRR